MNITGIISISGVSGLHKIIAKTKNGLVVENLNDKKRTAVHGSEKVSALEEISIFTTEDDLPLVDVLKKIADLEKMKIASVDPKADGAALRAYFKKALPNFDEERVYTSNIKKVIEWYNILQLADLLKAEEVEEKTTEANDAGEAKEKKATKAKKAAGDAKEAKAPKKTATAKPRSSAPKASTKSAGGPKVTTRKAGSA